jgi:hypothetical protein
VCWLSLQCCWFFRSDRDDFRTWIWCVRYGEDAMLEAPERADQLLEEGDIAGAEASAN